MKASAHPVFGQLSARAREAGWLAEGDRLEKGSLRYAVSVDAVPQSWARLLRGVLSEAILASRVAPTSGTPLLVLIAPAVSPSTDDELAAYVERVAPGTRWLLADERGRVYPHAPGLEVLARSVDVGVATRRPQTTTNLFTDTHQWLLKVLLAPLLPESLLSAPRARPLRTASVLAEVADVSVPAAARFVALLEEQGHLDRTHGDLRVARSAALLERWRAAVSKEPRDLPMRGARGELTDDGVRDLIGHANRWAHALGRPRPLVLGLFGACEALGQGVVHGAPRTVYLAPSTEQLTVTEGLVPAQPGERADVTLRVPRWPASVSRAAVEVSGLAVTDVLQCWLDVSHHPARGLEQADHLWRRVLQPALEGR